MGFDLTTDSLILRNMKVLDEASARLEVLTDLVWKQLEKCVRENFANPARKRQGSDWRVGDWTEDRGCWLSQARWRDPKSVEPDGYELWVEMTAGHGDSGEGLPEEDYHYLTRLLGLGKGHMRLRLDQDVLKAGEWKRFRSDEKVLFEKLGLPLDQTGMPQLQVRIDEEKLVLAISQDSFDEAFEPFIAAIQRFDDARPILDKILAKAKRRRGD